MDTCTGKRATYDDGKLCLKRMRKSTPFAGPTYHAQHDHRATFHDWAEQARSKDNHAKHPQFRVRRGAHGSVALAMHPKARSHIFDSHSSESDEGRKARLPVPSAPLCTKARPSKDERIERGGRLAKMPSPRPAHSIRSQCQAKPIVQDSRHPTPTVGFLQGHPWREPTFWGFG